MTLLVDLERVGVRFRVAGDRLTVKGPRAHLTPKVIECLSDHKGDTLTELRRRTHASDLPTDPLDWPEDWLDRFTERAAIMEYDGGLESAEAERRAEQLVRETYRRTEGRRQ